MYVFPCYQTNNIGKFSSATTKGSLLPFFNNVFLISYSMFTGNILKVQISNKNLLKAIKDFSFISWFQSQSVMTFRYFYVNVKGSRKTGETISNIYLLQKDVYQVFWMLYYLKDKYCTYLSGTIWGFEIYTWKIFYIELINIYITSQHRNFCCEDT